MAVNDLITFRKGTASQWISANPVLASGEPGYDLTNSILKIGNGVSNWVALSGIGSTSVGGGGSSSTSVIEYGNVSNFPASGVGSTIYISTDTGRIYRWASTVYQELGPVSYAPIGSDSRWNLFLPAAPTNLSATAGNGQVSLSWTAPSGVISQAPITDYSEQYSANSGTTWTTFSAASSTATTGTITGLTNGTSYVFRVAAINSVGVGAYTAASAAVTPMTFTPSSIGGLQLWLDASDASTLFDATSGGSLVAADGAVARWEDKSGNGRHFTQATSGKRPIRKTNQQNGLDALLFDGSNDCLDGGDYLNGQSGLTIFCVLKRANTSASHRLLHKIEDGKPGWAFTALSGGIIKAEAYADASLSEFTARQTTSAVDLSGFSLLQATIPAAAFGSATVRRNASAVSMNSAVVVGAGAATPANSTALLLLGSNRYQGVDYNVWNGNISELLIYTGALSDTDRAAVEAYLMTKWGIS